LAQLEANLRMVLFCISLVVIIGPQLSSAGFDLNFFGALLDREVSPNATAFTPWRDELLNISVTAGNDTHPWSGFIRILGASPNSAKVYLPIKECTRLHGTHRFIGGDVLTKGSPSGRNDVCDAGFQCAPRSLSDMETGICFPCIMGMYCPKGTITDTLSTIENVCKPGTLCERPDLSRPCPRGTFCPEATFSEGMDGLTVCDSERLPGAFCQESSPRPVACKAGYHCKNATVQTVCPKNTYCWEGSIKPKKCQFGG
jgi:hypothetical protein